MDKLKPPYYPACKRVDNLPYLAYKRESLISKTKKLHPKQAGNILGIRGILYQQ